METTPYDLMRYPTGAHPDTLPSRIAALAHLHGRSFAPMAGARVLEIGCGDGGNLLSLAAMAPRASLLGFDLAEGPVADGRALAAAAGLDNVEIRVGDILDPRVAEGPFDYVVAHGVYAWVPGPVRAALLALVARTLAPDGIAFISFNVMPGCSLRASLRAMLLTEVGAIAEPRARVEAARALLAALAEPWSEGTPHQRALAAQAQVTLARPAEVFFHDELGDCFAPQTLGDVVEASARHGLAYLCDAQPIMSVEAFFPDPASEALRRRANGDWIAFERLRDDLEQLQFREALLCRAGTPVERRLDTARLRPLFVQARLGRQASPDGHVFFSDERGVQVETDGVLTEALDAIAAAFPEALPLERLATDPGLGRVLARLAFSGVVTLLSEPPPVTVRVPARPRTSALARAQAARRMPLIATLRHFGMALPDGPGAELVALLDGTRDLATLARDLAAATGTDAGALESVLPEALKELALSGLLASDSV